VVCFIFYHTKENYYHITNLLINIMQIFAIDKQAGTHNRLEAGRICALERSKYKTLKNV